MNTNTNGASGAQEQTAVFENGAKRSGVRPRYDLIPLEAMLAIAERFTFGLKYGKDNWKRGGPAFFEDAKNHAIHHMMSYAAGDESEETSEQNLGAALWNLAALCWWERTGKAAYEKTANDPVLAMRGTLKGPHLPPYSQEQVQGWQTANGKPLTWHASQGAQDAVAEHVLELTEKR